MKLMRLFTTSIMITVYGSLGYGQTAPSTEIYLVDVFFEDDRIQYGTPVNITNWSGYDNQPIFTPDGESILFVSDRSGGQTDIYRYDIQTGGTDRVYFTSPESEYSPRISPDGKHITAIRKNSDGNSYLWKLPLPGESGRMEILVDDMDVGYYTWINGTTVALNVHKKENGKIITELYIRDLETGEKTHVINNVGRALYKIPNKKSFSFLDRSPDGQPSFFGWEIKEYDMDTGNIFALEPVVPARDGYCWTPRKTLMIAAGAKLLEAKPYSYEGWREVADFISQGIKTISRLAVSPKGNWIAFTAILEEENRPDVNK
jgi:WD40 repeat protein